MSTAIVANPIPVKDQLAATAPAALGDAAIKHVKVTLNDDTRRFSVEDANKFAQLCKNVRHVYEFPANASLLFKYRDEEGDMISVSSNAELAEAFRVAGDAHLRLVVTVIAAAPVAAVVPEAVASKVVVTAPSISAAAPTPETKSTLRLGPQVSNSAPMAAMAAKAAAVREAKATKAPSNPQVNVLKERNQALKDRLAQFKSRMHEVRASRDVGILQVQTLQRDLQYIRAEKNPKCKAVLALGRFVCDVSVPDGTVLTPGELVTKTWRFRNDSTEAWPAGTRLLFVGKNSDRMGAPDEVLVQREVLPGTEIDISVPLTAPNSTGRYVTYFRLCGPGQRKFGQRVWCSVIVKEAGSSDEESAKAPADADMVKYQHQLQLLAEMNLTNVRVNIRLLNKCDGNLEAVVERLFAHRVKVAARRAANPKFTDKAAYKFAKMEGKLEKKAAKLEAKAEKKAERIVAKAEMKSDDVNN